MFLYIYSNELKSYKNLLDKHDVFYVKLDSEVKNIDLY